MKRIAIWTLVICMLFALAACGSNTEPTRLMPEGETEPGTEPAAQTQGEPAQAELAAAEIYDVITYEVGGVKYEDQ